MTVVNTTKATVAASQYALGVGSSSDEEKREYGARYAPNSKFIELKNGETRPEKGVSAEGTTVVKSKQTERASEPIKIYDNPRVEPRVETYRITKPTEMSRPMEFSAYLTTAEIPGQARPS